MICLQYCHILTNEFTLSNVESKVLQQVEQFNTLISTTVPGENDDQVNDRLQRIRDALDRALGFMAGLITEFETTLNSDAYAQGKMAGTTLASGATKAGGAGSIAGAISGILTDHEWVLYVGLALGAACLIADFGVMSYMAYKSQESKKNGIALSLPKIYKTYQLAKNIKACINKFKNSRTGIYEEPDLIRKSTNCLRKYQEIPGYDENIFNKMTSLLIEKLPEHHQIKQQFKEVYESAQHLNCFQTLNKSSPPPLDDLDKQEIEMQEMATVILDSDLPKSYHQALQECKKSIADTFHLKKSKISFIEIKRHQAPRIRFTGHGMSEIH